MTRLWRRILCLAIAAIGCAAIASAAEPATRPAATPGDDLTTLSLEDLMNVEITSVSKKRERVADAAAAVYVIGQEDIRRSGMTSIPELLRLAPGLSVAQFNANAWAISSRGFNNVYSEKLLVLQDGRTVYSPVFSGVFWDAQDYLLEDLSRIEVIRGPGAAVWGANAVNGVINIISKEARETQGGLVVGRVGTEEDLGAIRYGGRIDEQTFYRVYAKYRDVDNAALSNDQEASDGWQAERGGFRVDRYWTPQDTMTVQGDIYSGVSGQTIALPVASVPYISLFEDQTRAAGGNLLARWTHTISERSDWSVQAYYDRVERDDLRFSYDLDTFDIEAQHRFPVGDRQEVIWGAGYRVTADQIGDSESYRFDPSRREDHLGSVFIQDDIALIPDRLHLIAGARFEINTYSGFEIQPTLRVAWTPDERQTIWGAVSRAVRTPSRFEEDVSAVITRVESPLGPPVDALVLGRNSFRSEELHAFEIGYRVRPRPTLTLDVTAFYNDYDSIRGASLGEIRTDFGGTPPRLIQPLLLRNGISAQLWGVEGVATATLSDEWRLTASYTFLHAAATRDHQSIQEASTRAIEEFPPVNQVQLRTSYDVTKSLQLNASAFYVDQIAGLDIPSYIRLDASVTWIPRNGFEMTAGIQNALDDRHPEFGSSLKDQNSEIERAAYLQVLWRF